MAFTVLEDVPVKFSVCAVNVVPWRVPLLKRIDCAASVPDCKLICEELYMPSDNKETYEGSKGKR